MNIKVNNLQILVSEYTKLIKHLDFEVEQTWFEMRNIDYYIGLLENV